MTVLQALACVQIPLIAALLLGACGAKLTRATRTGSIDDGLGPTALFPMQVRRSLALLMCAIEGGLGLGLIVTAFSFGRGVPATCFRVGAGLMFLVATCALIELRATRPDVGCGCFGDFSTAPVSGRTLARSALLAVAALSTIPLKPITAPSTTAEAGLLATLMAVELIVLGALSPELGEALIRLGYSEPCELREMSTERTMAALHRSKQWRRHSGLIATDTPTDIWRELCWRYVVFPASFGDQATEVVFAIFLSQRRPAIHAALVDAMTGAPLPWPLPPSKSGRKGRLAPGIATGVLATHASSAGTDMPFSSDL